ncbi:MAG: ATP-binding cassette domain-containing protein [Dongiaceae bacterium]
MPPTAEPLLAVAGLTVDYGPLRAVDGVDLELAAGARLGLIGESGSGKSQILLAIIGLLAGGARPPAASGWPAGRSSARRPRCSTGCAGRRWRWSSRTR